MGFHLNERTRKAVSLFVLAALALSVVLALSGSAVAGVFTWDKVSTIGFGLPNPAHNWTIFSLCEYNGRLYAGTRNSVDGCMVFRYESGTTWTRVVGQGAASTPTGPGFGDAKNISVVAMSVYNGKLYAGTRNSATSAQVWAFNGSTWARADTTDLAGSCVTEMKVFNDKLYCAVGAEANNGTGPARIWSFSGTSWSPVSTVGFGNPNNTSCRSMAVYKGKLYAGTYNGPDDSEIWRYESGTTWTQIMGSLPGTPEPAGWGENQEETRSMGVCNGKLYAGTDGESKLYQYDGSHWSFAGLAKISAGGQLDDSNDAIRSIVTWNGRLYISTGNDGNGTEVWELDLTRVTPWQQVNTDGFGAVPADVTNGANTMVVYGGRLWCGAGAPGGCIVYRAQAPILNVTKSAPSEASSGGTLKYTITITNTGDLPATGFTFKDAIPAHTSVVPGSVHTTAGTVTKEDPVTVTGINVAKGGTVTITFQVTVASGTVAGTVISNQGVLGKGVWLVPSSDPAHPGEGRPTDFTVTVPAPASATWYLAEGTTAWGFDAYITIQNPNNSKVTAQVTYMTGSGPVTALSVSLPPKSQATINPRDKLGDQDFSTKVVCKEGKTIAVDRTMSWTGPGAASPEAHSSIGVTSPGKTWYLPEGSSQWGFECWLLIQNPNTSAAKCTITYMIEGEGPKSVTKSVPASSRKTFNMADDIGQKDASIKVEGNIPVIPERAMYRNNRREGHDSIGTTSPANDYYLAEGATGYNVGYITYVLVQNPQGTPTDVTITYLTGSGQVAGPSFQMLANSRKTVRLNDQLPPNTDVSTTVHGSKPIIAERAMYWDNGTGEACHDSIGMASPHMTFYLPDGQTSEGRETWTLVQNPNGTDVTVDVTYMTPNGQGNVVKTETIPANWRKTFNMAEHSGISGRAAIMVRSKTAGKNIMVERAMYWNNRGAGTDTIGGYGY